MAGMNEYDASLTFYDNIDPKEVGVTRLRNVHVIGNVQLNDNRTLAFGDNGTTDAYVSFDGTNLNFYDSTVGVAKTLTQLAAAGSPTLDATFDGGKTIDGATSNANSFQVGGTNDKVQIWEEGSNDLRIGTTAAANLTFSAEGGTISFSDEIVTTTGHIGILADNGQLRLGASGATDAYLMFNGTNLVLYDSVAGAVTLSTLAGTNLTGPTVIGDMTFGDGKITLTDADAETALAITSAAVAQDVVTITANSVVAGTLLKLTATEATMNAGYYIRAYDETGAVNVFTVGEDGATVITGAASNVLTLTLGNALFTDGNIDIQEGKIEVDSTVDELSYFKRNHAASANPVVEIEQTHVGATGPALLLDQNATGAAKCLEITHDGDQAAISIAAGAARTGDVIAIAMADQLAQKAISITGAWTGAATTGLIDLNSSGALAADAAMIRVVSSGNIAAPNDGACLELIETGAAQPTSYALRIASTSNEALHVDTGVSLFDERVTITLADNTGPALAITNPDTTGNTNAVTITPSGSGAGLLISPQEADTVGFLITTVASSTVPLINIDATTGAGWIGAATTGCINITGDGALAADASFLRIASSGQPAAANDGVCIDVVESGAAQATSYAVKINSTNNEALHVATGMALFDELSTFTAGVRTKLATTNITVPPTGAELVTAFGAAAAGNTGFVGIVDDNNAQTGVYLVVRDNNAAGSYWYVAMTKAV
jgi:hypothetical protein